MKLALIGGGSVRTIYFARSFASFAEKLGFDTLNIMDNNAEKLNIFGTLAKYEAEKYAKRLGVHFDLNLTTNLEEAVKGADYVVTTIRVGGDDARVYDERIALSHNLIGQETTGAGGCMYALRTIPDLIEIMEAIKKYSNNATVFNFTNPSGLVTQALYDAGYDNIIGICDNATEIKMSLGTSLILNASDFFLRTYGLNHLTWSDQVMVGGKNILPDLFEYDTFVKNFIEFRYFDRELVKKLKSIPNGYLYYYYHREKALRNMLKSDKTRGESIRDINQKMLVELRKIDINNSPEEALDVFKYYMGLREGSYMQMELGASNQRIVPIDLSKLNIPELKGNTANTNLEIYEGYAGVAFNYIEGIRQNKEVEIAINVPNKGAIKCLKDDDVIEISCIVNKDGIHRSKIATVPDDNLMLMRVIKRYEKLVVEAQRTKSRDLVIEALMIHPLVNSYTLARDLFDDYRNTHKAYLEDYK